MTSAAKALPAVLERIDADLDSSLKRLFELIRIPSISTDSAFKDSCRTAADHVAKDLASLGFEAAVRQTEGHPVVVGKSNGAGANGGPRVLFYGHYDVQPVDPVDLWKTPPFEPKIEKLPDGRKIIHGRGACDDKGQFMTFVEALRAYKAVTGSIPIDVTMMIEGEEECGSKSLFDFVRSNANGPDFTRQGNLYVVRPDGTGLRQLTHYGGGVQLLQNGSFSPDGGSIVFATTENATKTRNSNLPDVFTMKLDGTGQTRVTSRVNWDGSPDWGPAG